MSSSLYETFGSEINYKFTAGKLEAYLDNASVKFPLPEARINGLKFEENSHVY